MFNKMKMLALAGLGFIASGATAIAQEATPLTNMVSGLDLGDAEGAVVAAAGVIIGLVVLIFAIRKVLGLWGR